MICRLWRTWDRLRPLLGEVTCREREPEERRELEERSCCKPALTAAAACKEVEADRLGEGEPLWP